MPELKMAGSRPATKQEAPDSATRYGWSPGETIKTPRHESNFGFDSIEQGDIQPIDPATYRTRNQSIAEGASPHVDVIFTPAEIVNILSQNYAEVGYVTLEPLTGKSEPEAMRICAAVLPTSYETLSELREHFQSGNARKQMEAAGLQEHDLPIAEAVGSLMAQAVEQAFTHQTRELEKSEREVANFRGSGKGKNAFDSRDDHYYQQTGREKPAGNEQETVGKIGMAVAQALGTQKPVETVSEVERLRAEMEELKALVREQKGSHGGLPAVGSQNTRPSKPSRQ